MGRLTVIDSLRGVAAIGVVMHHIFLSYRAVIPSVPGADHLFWIGSTGVWLFIVISGFCIHLRYAKAMAMGRPAPLKFLPFWKRRLRRLYPAYAAALALYILLEGVNGSLQLGGFFFYDLGLHLLLLHNLDRRTVFGICSVFWSLALEEHLYLAYFLLVLLRNRLGWMWTLAVCLLARGAGLLLHAALKSWFGWESAFGALFMAQWFVWALGAVSVEAALGLVPLPRAFRHPGLAGLVLGSLAVAIACEREGFLSPLLSKIFWAFRDPALGLGFFILVNAVVERERSRGARVGLGVTARAWASIGVFSYSLYLVHQAVLLHIVPATLGWIGAEPSLLLVLLLAPLCVLFAWIFFKVFERPFLAPSTVA